MYTLDLDMRNILKNKRQLLTSGRISVLSSPLYSFYKFMNNYAITNGLIDSIIRDFIILQLYFAQKFVS